MSSDEIYTKVLKELEHQKNKWPAKGRYLDAELFEATGPFVDWRRLLIFDA